MSGDEGDKKIGKAPSFSLEVTSRDDFEEAVRRAEEGLQAPLPTFARYEEEPEEAETLSEEASEAELAEEEDQVRLQLTLREETALVGEFSGAQSLQASTPAEATEGEEGTAEPFREIPRSGADTLAGGYDDWLAPLDPEDWSANAPVGGLTVSEDTGLLADFSGAETMPEIPEEEEPAFVNDGLPSLTAAEGELLSNFSGAELYGDEEEEAQEPDSGAMDDLDRVIFSSDPRASAPPQPRVTARTEPEFIFKR